jgi:hypothetical protein
VLAALLAVGFVLTLLVRPLKPTDRRAASVSAAAVRAKA